MTAPSSRDGLEHALAQALADVRAAEHSVAVEGTLVGLADALDWLEIGAEAGDLRAGAALGEALEALERIL